MKKENIEEIIKRWKITDAFAKGVAKDTDLILWRNICESASFKTSLSFYTSIDKTYMGMLTDINYFLDNCSVNGVISYISFYEKETDTPWVALYASNVNSHKNMKPLYEEEDTNWWSSHIDSFVR